MKGVLAGIALVFILGLSYFFVKTTWTLYTTIEPVYFESKRQGYHVKYFPLIVNRDTILSQLQHDGMSLSPITSGTNKHSWDTNQFYIHKIFLNKKKRDIEIYFFKSDTTTYLGVVRFDIKVWDYPDAYCNEVPANYKSFEQFLRSKRFIQ
jgi:hypothetical protein